LFGLLRIAAVRAIDHAFAADHTDGSGDMADDLVYLQAADPIAPDVDDDVYRLTN